MNNKLVNTIGYVLAIIISISVLLLFIDAISGCEPPEPDPEDDTNCGPVEKHMVDLQCDDLLWLPDSEDRTWKEWCEWAQKSGIDTLPLSCMLEGETCEQIEGCLDD